MLLVSNSRKVADEVEAVSAARLSKELYLTTKKVTFFLSCIECNLSYRVAVYIVIFFSSKRAWPISNIV